MAYDRFREKAGIPKIGNFGFHPQKQQQYPSSPMCFKTLLLPLEGKGENNKKH
jgi:hypothetical protein